VPPRAPTGTIAFLFTDIEGSSQRWESFGVAMDGAVKEHERLLRGVFGSHGGYVFKTVGDEFCVAFARAADALAAAVDAQRALDAVDFSAVGGLHVRMGVHAGEAAERDGDYFGPTVNTVARLSALAYGGQIVLSGVAREAMGDELPDGLSLVDLGRHRLRDVAAIAQVWQVAGDGLRAEFPPLRSAGIVAHNLPPSRTELVGRERDLAQIEALVRERRLVTLVGAGGVGKTRAAVAVGAQTLQSYADGAWFADLARVTDAALVANVIAGALGMSQIEGRRVDESLVAWLRDKHLLLILDNCEHVLETVAPLADAVLDAAPGVRILATSREPLRVGGEQTVRLSSLEPVDAERLFAQRAALVSKSFTLSDRNAEEIATICRRLDGIPLAIELAAARAGTMSIASLARRLDERFAVLTAGSRTALPRQQTLHAMVSWSVDLLSPSERGIFERLGVFVGAFRLESATTICMPEDEAAGAFELLASLCEKSLLTVDVAGAHESYRLLETMREFALEQQRRNGEREDLALRHAHYFRQQALAADERYGTQPADAWLAAAELDLDNYRAALEWALRDRHDAALGSDIAGSLEQLWYRGGLAAEGSDWLSLARTQLHEAAHPRQAGRVWQTIAAFRDGSDKYDAAQRALRLYRAAGDERGEMWALVASGFGLQQMGRIEEANAEFEHALAGARRFPNPWLSGVLLNRRGTIARDRREFAAGRELLAEAIERFRPLYEGGRSPIVLMNLAELEFADGNAPLALELASEAAKSESLRHGAMHLANLHACCALFRVAADDLDGAAADAAEGLRCAQHERNALAATIALAHLALIAALRGDPERAAAILGYVDASFERLRYRRNLTEAWGYERLVAAVSERLPQTRVQELRAKGASWQEDRAVAEAAG
jgi:predicted ATPase